MADEIQPPKNIVNDFNSLLDEYLVMRKNVDTTEERLNALNIEKDIALETFHKFRTEHFVGDDWTLGSDMANFVGMIADPKDIKKYMKAVPEFEEELLKHRGELVLLDEPSDFVLARVSTDESVPVLQFVLDAQHPCAIINTSEYVTRMGWHNEHAKCGFAALYRQPLDIWPTSFWPTVDNGVFSGEGIWEYFNKKLAQKTEDGKKLDDVSAMAYMGYVFDCANLSGLGEDVVQAMCQKYLLEVQKAVLRNVWHHDLKGEKEDIKSALWCAEIVRAAKYVMSMATILDDLERFIPREDNPAAYIANVVKTHNINIKPAIADRVLK